MADRLSQILGVADPIVANSKVVYTQPVSQKSSIPVYGQQFPDADYYNTIPLNILNKTADPVKNIVSSQIKERITSKEDADQIIQRFSNYQSKVNQNEQNRKLSKSIDILYSIVSQLDGDLKAVCEKLLEQMNKKLAEIDEQEVASSLVNVAAQKKKGFIMQDAMKKQQEDYARRLAMLKELQ